MDIEPGYFMKKELLNMQGGLNSSLQFSYDWSDNCLLTMGKNVLIMKTFLGALSICNYSARIYLFGVHRDD